MNLSIDTTASFFVFPTRPRELQHAAVSGQCVLHPGPRRGQVVAASRNFARSPCRWRRLDLHRPREGKLRKPRTRSSILGHLFDGLVDLVRIPDIPRSSTTKAPAAVPTLSGSRPRARNACSSVSLSLKHAGPTNSVKYPRPSF